MSKISKELVGASAVPVILSILDKSESYGYEIMQKVKQLSEGKIEWKEGSLYPVLHKLEKNGLIKSLWKMAENGRHRKYYAINKKGRKALQDEIQNWLMVQAMLKELWADLTPVQ
ncbi:MAG: helix-turn-helix transcriptional regulator [Prolixibacteraceae bacterium]|jgi:DNA-binding PadR family transcriptional regulator|nr:helix-turn-helix transcriptional regulator [Prolixibacteraceae bacterium]HOO85507.1 PadR family transcriptional regulator [Prolixibacteraceae bacterium]